MPKNDKMNVKQLRRPQNFSSRSVTMVRIAKYGARNFVRNTWLSVAATLVMTITLVILFATALSSTILASTAESMREKIDITIFFAPNTELDSLNSMAEKMRANSNVRNVEVSDSKMEYDKFIEDNKSDADLMETLADENMAANMLAAMQSTMRVKVKDLNNLDSIKDLVDSDGDFQSNLDTDKAPTYDDNREEINTVTGWANLAKNGGIVLGIVFLVISILVIFNTIRMAIFSRRDEIEMMKLIGADKKFVRGPFIIEAQLYGIISGVVASVIGYFGFRAIASPLESYGINISIISDILQSSWLVAIVLIMIFIGMSIGYFSARLAVRRHLRS